MLELFRGRHNLTYGGERLAFVLTLLWALPAAGILGAFVHEEIAASQVALLIVVAMIYVTLARGRLLGSSVRVHEQQYPRLFSIVRECAAMLQVPMPLIFVREDYQIPITSVGLGQPYALVFSSHWIEHFQDDELRFLAGRELGHIASGHTRFTSLLSANGNENALISLIFGGWLRRTELTCDRVGLLCCGSLDTAIRAIAVAAFHEFGRTVDYALFAEQGREVRADSGLRLGEWLGAMPYATRRMEALRAFAGSELYRYHQPGFAERRMQAPPVLVQAHEASVSRRDMAGFWRRSIALGIDAIVVTALIQTFANHVRIDEITRAMVEKKHASAPLVIGFGNGVFFAMFVAYLALCVGLTGQSLGMIVAGLRVVRTDFARPSGLIVIWRYLVLLVTFPVAIVLVPFRRVLPHDWLSRTRVVKNERLHVQLT